MSLEHIINELGPVPIIIRTNPQGEIYATHPVLKSYSFPDPLKKNILLVPDPYGGNSVYSLTDEQLDAEGNLVRTYTFSFGQGADDD